MHNDREEITDTLELARRINSSTDIVTDQEHTIDAQQQTIDQTITQAAQDVIAAFEHLTPGLVPIIEKIDQSTGEIMTGITGLAQKIDNIDFTPVEEKLDEIEGELMQGVTGLNQAVDEIKELVSGVTGYAQQETLVQGITAIRSDVSELREELGQGFSGVEEKIDQGFTGVMSAVQGITGYALDVTVAKEQTLVRGVSSIESKIDNIDFTPVEIKLDEIEGELIQGLTGVKADTENLLLGVEEIKEDIGDLDEIIEAINGDTVDAIVNDYIGEQLILIDNMIGDWSSSDDSSE